MLKASNRILQVVSPNQDTNSNPRQDSRVLEPGMAILWVRRARHYEQDARPDNIRAHIQASEHESKQLFATAEPQAWCPGPVG